MNNIVNLLQITSDAFVCDDITKAKRPLILYPPYHAAAFGALHYVSNSTGCNALSFGNGAVFTRDKDMAEALAREWSR